MSLGDCERGSELSKQFDILRKVRERYPSAGLVAVGGGRLQLKYVRERALHQDCNHIELTGALSEEAISELIQRANVLLKTDHINSDSFEVAEARKSETPVILAYVQTDENVEMAALQVLHILQTARPRQVDPAAVLADGVDDVIQLYKQIVPAPDESSSIART